MKYKFYISFLGLLIPLLFALNVYGQTPDFDNYKILMSTGSLPINLEDALKDDLATNSQSNKSRRAKKDEKNFIVKSTSSLDKLLRGGAVIYNDPVGAYLTKILNHVLSNNGIEEEVTVYFLRSEEVNAYAMDKNFIFLTAGLFSQVTSEAQLAMILSHEYIHYKNKHSRTEFIENLAIVRDYKSYKTSSTDARFLIANFSRELETEADKQGFAMYEAANYSYNGAIEAFEVLKYSHLPFEEIKFEKSFLESNDLKFPKEYFLEEITPVQDADQKEDDDDKYRTHPHIDARIVDMQELTEGKSNAGRKDFIISETDFYTYRKLARYEVCRLYLIEQNYEEALYSAYTLLKEEPNSQYLQKVVLKSLYGLTKFSNANKFSKVHSNYKKKQGESQQVYFFVDAMSKKEINYTAIHYAWKLHEKYPDDGDISFILHDLVYEGCKSNKLTPFNLKTEHPDTGQVATNDSLATDTTQNKTNKYSKIKSDTDTDNNKKKTKKKTNNFIEYAFVDILKNNEFKNVLKEEYKKWEDKQAADAEAIKNKRKGKKVDEDEIDETRNIDGMLVLNPVIMRIDTRKSENKIYYATNNKKKEMVDNFVMLSKKQNIESRVYNPVDLKEDDVDKFNEMFILNTAMYEMLSLPDKIEMLPTDNLELKNIALNNETNYLTNIGVVTFIERKNLLMPALIAYVTFGFGLPYLIYKIASPNATTYIYMSVYDIEKSKFVFSDAVSVRSSAGQDTMGSLLYDMIIRMKNNNKTKSQK